MHIHSHCYSRYLVLCGSPSYSSNRSLFGDSPNSSHFFHPIILMHPYRCYTRAALNSSTSTDERITTMRADPHHSTIEKPFQYRCNRVQPIPEDQLSPPYPFPLFTRIQFNFTWHLQVNSKNVRNPMHQSEPRPFILSTMISSHRAQMPTKASLQSIITRRHKTRRLHAVPLSDSLPRSNCNLTQAKHTSPSCLFSQRHQLQMS
jgi:hypothetical protein